MPYPSHGVLGTASPPSLEQTLGGARIHPRMAAGTQDHFLKGGCHILTSGRFAG